jgi:hypothetical protein
MLHIKDLCAIFSALDCKGMMMNKGDIPIQLSTASTHRWCSMLGSSKSWIKLHGPFEKSDLALSSGYHSTQLWRHSSLDHDLT